MSDCCSTSCSSNTSPKRQTCPGSGLECKEVSIKTILHHIKEPWAWEEKNQAYYFCEDPDCEVVYFGQDNSVIVRSELRTPVGVKEKGLDALVCYCFGVSFGDAVERPELKRFVTAKLRMVFVPVKSETHQVSAV
jgi:Zinc binding domain